MSPYHKALELIEQHPGTGSATALAKLVLSLYNGRECPFAFGECVASLDQKNTRLALDMCAYYCEHGEDKNLREVSARICKITPDLWELGHAAYQAKVELLESWRNERNDDNEDI